MKILLTGFEPFADEKINPSWEAVKRIESKIKNCKIFKVKIPTVFNKAIDVLKKKMEDIDPDVVLSIGQAGGETDIRVERVAININDARISDNEGNEPVDATIFEDGKNAYFSNLPIKAVVQKIQDDGIPAHVSNSAGTFVCNNLMYGLLYLAEKKYNNIRGGFIHVPFIP